MRQVTNKMESKDLETDFFKETLKDSEIYFG